MANWMWFCTGWFLGSIVSIAIVSLCMMAKRGDEMLIDDVLEEELSAPPLIPPRPEGHVIHLGSKYLQEPVK